MNPVSLVTIHHEGAGVPVDWARGGEGGYCLWIGDENGDHVYDVLRNPWIAWATLNFNHQSLDICLSGNRMVTQVTPADIDTIRMAVARARSLGWVVDAPYVRSHHDSPGSSTVCPGAHALDPLTWLAIVTACHKEVPAPMPAQAPDHFPPLNAVSFCAFRHPTIPLAAVAIDADGHVFADPPEAYMGSPYDDHTGKPKPYWTAGGKQRFGASVNAAPNGGTGYVLVDTAEESYGPNFG